MFLVGPVAGRVALPVAEMDSTVSEVVHVRAQDEMGLTNAAGKNWCPEGTAGTRLKMDGTVYGAVRVPGSVGSGRVIDGLAALKAVNSPQ